MNKYYIRARLFPTLLTSIPLVIFINKLVGLYFIDQLNDVAKIIPAISVVGFSAAVIFLMVQVNRLLAKEIFQRWFFQDELGMPTTEYLLTSNEFLGLTIKSKLRTKISSDFDLQLFDSDNERNDDQAARKLIATSVSQIRNKLRDNPILLQHNIDYGFIRNLLGGSLLALVISVILIFYSVIANNSSLQYTGIVLSIVYLLILLSGKALINRYAHYYAKILFEQYLSI